MLQMGGDFGFGDANAWFKNLDVLLEAVNKEGRVNVSKHRPCVAFITVLPQILVFSISPTLG